MNKYELQRKYDFDMIAAMIEYARKKNPNSDSKEYQNALSAWGEEHELEFKKNWELENGELEDEVCLKKNPKE